MRDRRIYKKPQNRFFSDLELAKSAMQPIAIENQCKVYLYAQTYGLQDSQTEYSVRFRNEVIDPKHPKVLSTFIPKNLKQS